MTKITFKIVGLALLLATPYAAAHIGHDHGHWTSGIIHALWIGAALAVVALSVFMLKKTYYSKTQKNKSKEG